MTWLARFIYRTAHQEVQQQQQNLLKQLYHAQFSKRRFCRTAKRVACTPQGIALLALSGVLLVKSKHKFSILRKLVLLRRALRHV
ncbi:hypothetical protein C3B51_19760 [Pseudoalteromonas rubra]|uniref:Uncharacterized protein n=1 Tax=Pseudoalteromonas rubra TaxID=43658 RepID=A0A4Q7E3N6_9GAMM|nr:hypothetical protein [Pseudoalteromonas rubra]RZM74396.1 hypothetical protein C3B51_19760 [Pseudoalteromonas rubra]